MPPWRGGELIEAPVFHWRNWFGMLGPALLMAGSAIGGGEWLTGPLVTARFGGNLFWLATLSIVFQLIYNLEICRYTLYSGEPIFTGKFRIPPAPWFWLLIYLVLDFGAFLPYLATSAATPLLALFLGHIPNDKSTEIVTSFFGIGLTEKHLLQVAGNSIFVLAMVPLIFGGKVYDSLKRLMTIKIVLVFGFLLILAFGYSRWETWGEIFGGFLKFGNVPVVRGEDLNENGILDPGEDWDGDGHLDGVEPRVDKNGTAGNYEAGEFEDLDGDGNYDGDKVDNIFVSLWEGRGFPPVNMAVLSIICAMVAISGQGGLSNTPLSNYTRDQGWGMGAQVGAIPSIVGGMKIPLSHEGCVFPITKENLSRWKKWYRFVFRDQVFIWLPACFIGLALPSMLSVQFLDRGKEVGNWVAAGMTADRVSEHVSQVSGATLGSMFWFLTLFCGFMVLAPSMSTSADGTIRRWLDVLWTASPAMRRIDPRHIGKVYFVVLCAFVVLGLTMLNSLPSNLILPYATTLFNYALAFSCFHSLLVNLVLLPRELKPNWIMRLGMFAGGIFFLIIALASTYSLLFPYGI